MPIKGSCLCGGVRFELDRASGPAEICHCVRCQKRSGATALEMVPVDAQHYRLLTGAELIHTYAAPILNNPPAFTAHFCRRCGSCVPWCPPGADTLEVPAGLFDDDPQVEPDKHIFVDFMPAWNTIRDRLPQFGLRALVKFRFGKDLPADYVAKDHSGRPRDV